MFLVSSSAAGVGTLLRAPAVGNTMEAESAEKFSWNTGKLKFEFSIAEEQLRQHLILPVGIESPRESLQWAGVESALLFTGEDSPDSGMKQSAGSPRQRLKFVV